MESFEQDNQIIYFKSSESMKELTDSSIDAIITSPPYNVGKDYSVNGNKYNDKQSFEDYLSFLTRVFAECYRVASENCVFFLNIGDSAQSQGKSEKVVSCAEEVGFRRLQTVIWSKSIFGKGHYTPSGGNRRLNNLWENIFLLVKSKNYEIDPKKIGIPYSDKSNIGRYSDVDLRDAGDIWFIPYSKTTGATIKKGHDAPFPIELPLKCLKLLVNPKTVLDPFAGTGSTLRASKELGIKGYGYEILPRIDVITAKLDENIDETNTPLLPQMEYYNEFLSKFLEHSLKYLDESIIQEIKDEFNLTEIRKFEWACKDLKIVNPLSKSSKISDEKKFNKIDNYF